ncbi:MAG: hypothetical protein WB502_13280 [Thermoactinomyces sp.]
MRKIFIGTAIALVIVLGVVFLAANSGNPQNTVQQPDSLETQQNQVNNADLIQKEVEQGWELQKNGANGIYVVHLLSGSFAGEAEGKILSDSNCTPDEKGISRCHNEIELDNQQKITVITPHNMQKNRCLRPGETVRLSTDKKGNIIVEAFNM